MTELEATTPTPAETRSALRRIRDLLDLRIVFLHQGRWHFPLEDGWTISLLPDSGRRFRIEACHRGRPCVTLWTFAGDDARLAAILAEVTGTAVGA